MDGEAAMTDVGITGGKKEVTALSFWSSKWKSYVWWHDQQSYRRDWKKASEFENNQKWLIKTIEELIAKHSLLEKI